MAFRLFLAVIVGSALAALVTSTPVAAASLGSGAMCASAGGGGSSAPACELAGGVDCEMAGVITAAAGMPLALVDNGGGVTIQSSDFTNSFVIISATNSPDSSVTIGTTTTTMVWDNDQNRITSLDQGLWSSSGSIPSTGNGLIQASASTTDPRFTFFNDDDVGIGRTAANEMGLFAGGAGSAEYLVKFGAFSPQSTTSKDLGETNLRFRRLFVADGTSSVPSIAVGQDDAGLSYNSNELVLEDTTGHVRVRALGAGNDVAITAADDITLNSADLFVSAPGTGTFTVSSGNPNAYPVVMAATAYFIPTTRIGTTVTLPTCATALAGAITYLDDTDDANNGKMCFCRRDSGGSFAWRVIDDSAACP